eukprot:768388-Hanusia_phi.AAC.10
MSNEKEKKRSKKGEDEDEDEDEDMDEESAVVVDHLLDLVSRGNDENRRELQGKLVPHMCNSDLLEVCSNPSEEAVKCIFACLLVEFDVAGSLEERGERLLRSCSVRKCPVDLQTFRQMVIPVLEVRESLREEVWRLIAAEKEWCWDRNVNFDQTVCVDDRYEDD